MSKLSKSIPQTPKSVLSEEYFEPERKENSKSAGISGGNSEEQHLIPTPTPSSSPVDLTAEVELLRKVLKASRRSPGGADASIKHMYTANAALTPTDGAAVFISLNSIAAGTTQTTRTGNAIWNYSVTYRFVATYIPAATANLASIQPSQFRIVVFRAAIPDATPATYANIFSQAAAIPIVDPNALFVTLGTGDMNAVRNPNTFDFYHIISDELFNMTHTPIGLSATTGALVGAHAATRHIDLHKSKTTFFSTGANDVVTNGINLMIISNGATADGGNFNIEMTTDFVFSDAPNT